MLDLSVVLQLDAQPRLGMELQLGAAIGAGVQSRLHHRASRLDSWPSWDVGK